MNSKLSKFGSELPTTEVLNFEAAIIEDGANALSRLAHGISRSKGFYDDDAGQNLAEKIALMHSELSEALEETRQLEPRASEKIFPHTAEAEELADAVIRIFDYAEFRGLILGEAIVEKLRYNATRPYKHNKRF